MKYLDFHFGRVQTAEAVADVAQSFTYQFNALRGRQAGRAYYAAVWSSTIAQFKPTKIAVGSGESVSDPQ